MDALGQLRICVEKPLESEETAMTGLKASANSEDHFHRLRAAFYTQKLWPAKTTIRIGFYPKTAKTASFTPVYVMQAMREPDGSSPDIDPIEYKIRSLSVEDAVKMVVNERIQPIVGLSLVFVDDINNANVRIGFDPSNGSWSLVGTDCLQSTDKTMNFAWLDAATIMHEFGHLLGMIHEHQNPRGNTIDWNVPAVDLWAQSTQGWDKQTTYNNIIQRYSVNQINGSKYDPKSIMLYFFPAKLTLDNKGTRINDRLSRTDIEYISKMYPGGKSSGADFEDPSDATRSKSWIKMPLMLIWLIPAIVLFIIAVIVVMHKGGRKRRR